MPPTLAKSSCPAKRSFSTFIHHLAHILDRAGAGLDDNGGDRGLSVRLGHLLGQVTLNDVNLGLFLGGEFGPLALGIHLDAFLALAHHFLQHVDDFRRGDAVHIARAGGDVLVLDGRSDQAKRGERRRVPRLHGRFDIVIDPLPQHGRHPSCVRYRGKAGQYRIRLIESMHPADFKLLKILVILFHRRLDAEAHSA